MLHIMSVTAAIYYILASFKLVCEIDDDDKIIRRNM
jgi:hypothetical protein